VRLAFSTAIHAETNIMLTDEVFAVGDEAFQKKCMVKMAEMQKQGKTIILVSHNLGMIKDLCQRAMLLNNGEIASIGDTDKVVDDYLAMLEGDSGDA